MKARKRNPTKAVMAQFFASEKDSVVDHNCSHCGAYVNPHMHVQHVEWHLRLTKIIEGKRDKL